MNMSLEDVSVDLINKNKSLSRKNKLLENQVRVYKEDIDNLKATIKSLSDSLNKNKRLLARTGFDGTLLG